MPMTSKEMLNHLNRNGFIELRQDGSHIFLENKDTNKRTTVPYTMASLEKG